MRRIIAYIFHYKREGDILQKYNNAGFCRVEQNCGKDVVTLCLKDGCGVEGVGHLYTLMEQHEAECAEKVYNKIKLDKCYEVCSGVLNDKLYLDNVDGIYVECGGRIYVALWKDNCECIKVTYHSENTDREDKENLERKASDNFEAKVSEQIHKKQMFKEEIQKENSRKIEKPNTKKNVDKTSKTEKGNDDYADYTRIYNRLCKIRMVLEGVEYPAVRLKPYELMFLPRSCWRMANNVFLMESYYRHGHILFMEYNGGYVLAVPWKLDKRMVNQGKGYGFSECLVGHEYGRERDKKLYFLKYL